MTQIESNIIAQGDYLIDITTGEIVGMTNQAIEFTVTDEKSAEWVLEKMSIADAEILALQARLDALSKNLKGMIADQERRKEFLAFKFGPSLEAFAAKRLEGGKGKTLKLAYGTLSFRALSARLKVANEAKAVAWAKKEAPSAVKVTESFQAYGLDKAVSEMLIEKWDEQPAELKEAFELVPTRNSFHVKTGVGS